MNKCSECTDPATTTVAITDPDEGYGFTLPMCAICAAAETETNEHAVEVGR
jgi:hypothetical protein